MKISDFNVSELRAAEDTIQQLEQVVIERARLYLKMNGQYIEDFKNGSGFSVRVQRTTLLDEGAPEVVFLKQDIQGRGMVQQVRVPREFIFAEDTDEREARWLEYQKLKKEFGD